MSLKTVPSATLNDNQNVATDSGELQTLESLGITQVNLTYDDGSAFGNTANDVSVLGNTPHGLASFVRNSAVVSGAVGDVSPAYNEFGWRQVETADGYRIEFESGGTMAFWEATGQISANVDLTAGGFVGAFGGLATNAFM